MACAARNLATFTSSLWTHLKAKHPRLHKALKSKDCGAKWLSDSDAGPSLASTSESELRGSATFLCEVSYKQMVDALCLAPSETIADAIEALQQAQERAAVSVMDSEP